MVERYLCIMLDLGWYDKYFGYRERLENQRLHFHWSLSSVIFFGWQYQLYSVYTGEYSPQERSQIPFLYLPFTSEMPELLKIHQGNRVSDTVAYKSPPYEVFPDQMSEHDHVKLTSSDSSSLFQQYFSDLLGKSLWRIEVLPS